MENLKILLNGCNGKMGHEVVDVVNKNETIDILCGFDKQNDNSYPFPVYTNLDNIKDIPDAIIDFSVPISTLNILKYATSKKIPTIIATTGFTDEQFEEIKKASATIPIFQSYNMSFDIFLLQKALELVTPYLHESTDIEIIESHHNRKIDAPSGTALMLADTINNSCNNKYNYNLNRLNQRKKREKNEIGFSSIRGGNIVGEHTIKFIGQNDTFEISHKAYSRKLFAEGAIRATEFLVGKGNGLYNMNDIFKGN